MSTLQHYSSHIVEYTQYTHCDTDTSHVPYTSKCNALLEYSNKSPILVTQRSALVHER